MIMVENTQKSEPSRSLISDAIILAFASVSAYYFSFSYEKSFLLYFGVPSQFITIDLTTLLSFGVIVLFVILFVFPVLNLFMIIVSRIKNEHIVRLIRPYWFFLIIFLTDIYLFGLEKPEYLGILLVICLVFLFFDFIFPLLTQRDKKTYTEKLIGQEEIESSIQYLPKNINIKFGREVAIFITLFILGVMISSDAGLAEAIRKEDYLFINTQPQLIVIRIYSNRLICAQYDEMKKEVLPIFTIITLTNNSPELIQKKTGKIHVATPLINNSLQTPIIVSTP
jgi:hypothetical protein